MNKPHYLAITGGVGGAKLALGLTHTLQADQLSLVVNTGDDFEHLGVHISPDIDTLVYTLSGQCNPETGWGRRNESWNFMDSLKALGGETWFKLGDRDMAMHIERTLRLKQGHSLTQVTMDLANVMGIEHQILPMSNDAVRTKIITENGLMDFQDYFVRHQCQPVVKGFEFHGHETAVMNPDVTRVLESPNLAGVIICPSNPFVSIDPILSVPGFRTALQECQAPVIAVSPVVSGLAIKGPTVKMMQELDVPNTATWVAKHYSDMLDGFILDSTDTNLQADILELGLKVLVTQTVMQSLEDRVDLAQDCLGFLANQGFWREI